MGEAFDYVPVRRTRAFIEAQNDSRLDSWLKMQEAAIPLLLMPEEAPDLQPKIYSRESLRVIEEALIGAFGDESSLWTDVDSTERAMRFVFYIGECFGRSFEGDWVNLPSTKVESGSVPAVDLPFRETFIIPTSLLRIALVRRTGTEIEWVYDRAAEGYEAWVREGRPELVSGGTLSEES